MSTKILTFFAECFTECSGNVSIWIIQSFRVCFASSELEENFSFIMQKNILCKFWAKVVLCNLIAEQSNLVWTEKFCWRSWSGCWDQGCNYLTMMAAMDQDQDGWTMLEPGRVQAIKAGVEARQTRSARPQLLR